MDITSILAKKGPKVFTISPEQSIRQALALLAEHNIGALVVVDKAGKPGGIISERDIVREAARNEQMFSKAVSEIMTKEVIVGAPQDDLISVGNTMTEKRIRHLPIVDKGTLIGIVTLGDVVKAQRDRYRGEVDTLQIQVMEGQT
jgi:CBS domain-containing protein